MDVLMDEQLATIQPGHVMRTHGGAKVRVDAPLGAGNEGVVFKGRLNGEAVALKLFKPDSTGRRQRRTRALVRMNLSQTLNSAIAGPFEDLLWEGRVGHIAPLVPGFSVQQLVDEPALLSPRQRLMATIKLGGLVAGMHRRGLAFGDLNKGAVKIETHGVHDVNVSLVDLDSSVLPGEPAPLTLGTPDTCAPELRHGHQPASVGAWQAADWTAYGHVALELLLAKTAACGIEDAEAQVTAFLGVPPCLTESALGRSIDRAAGMPAHALPEAVRRSLARLFEQPARRDGRALVQALAHELINNHQVACRQCGLQYLVHEGGRACPGCGLAGERDLMVVLPDGARRSLTSEGLTLGRKEFGERPGVLRVHARVFTLGAVPFVCAFGPGSMRRAGTTFRLPIGLHVPLQRGDELTFGNAASVLLA